MCGTGIKFRDLLQKQFWHLTYSGEGGKHDIFTFSRWESNEPSGFEAFEMVSRNGKTLEDKLGEFHHSPHASLTPVWTQKWQSTA